MKSSLARDIDSNCDDDVDLATVMSLQRRDHSFTASSRTSSAAWKSVYERVSSLKYLNDGEYQKSPITKSPKKPINKQEFQTIQSHLSQRRRHCMVDTIRRSPGAIPSPQKQIALNQCARTANVLIDKLEVAISSPSGQQQHQWQSRSQRSKAWAQTTVLKAPQANNNNEVGELPQPPSPGSISLKGSPRSVIKFPHSTSEQVDKLEVAISSPSGQQQHQWRSRSQRSKASAQTTVLKASQANNNNEVGELPQPPSPGSISLKGSPRSVIKFPHSTSEQVKEEAKLLQKVLEKNTESNRDQPRKRISNGSCDSLPPLVDFGDCSQSEASLYSGSGESSLQDGADSNLLSPIFVLTRRGSSEERWGSKDDNRDRLSPAMPRTRKKTPKGIKTIDEELTMARKHGRRSMSYTPCHETSSIKKLSPRRKGSLDSAILQPKKDSREGRRDASKFPRKPRRTESKIDPISVTPSSSSLLRGKTSHATPRRSIVTEQMAGSDQSIPQPPLTSSSESPKRKQTTVDLDLQKQSRSEETGILTSEFQEDSPVFAKAFFSRSNNLVSPTEQVLTWTRTRRDNFSDWVLLCKSGSDQVYTYHIHRCIVGLGPRASEYFYKQFQCKDQKSADCNVTSMELLPRAAELVPMMLNYMYNLQPFEIETETAASLRYLATKFGINTLFQAVNAFIKEDMDESNVGIYYTHASVFQDEQLFRAASMLKESAS
jgi:hypothetical protein